MFMNVHTLTHLLHLKVFYKKWNLRYIIISSYSNQENLVFKIDSDIYWSYSVEQCLLEAISTCVWSLFAEGEINGSHGIY